MTKITKTFNHRNLEQGNVIIQHLVIHQWNILIEWMMLMLMATLILMVLMLKELLMRTLKALLMITAVPGLSVPVEGIYILLASSSVM